MSPAMAEDMRRAREALSTKVGGVKHDPKLPPPSFDAKQYAATRLANGPHPILGTQPQQPAKSVQNATAKPLALNKA